MKTLLLLLVMLSAGQTSRIKTIKVDLVVKENVYIKGKLDYSVYVFYDIVKTDQVKRNLVIDEETPTEAAMGFLEGAMGRTRIERHQHTKEVYVPRDWNQIEATELITVKPYKFFSCKFGKKRYIDADSYVEVNVADMDSCRRFEKEYPHLRVEPIW